MPSTNSAIAVGWSPFGWYSDLSSKRTPPSDFSGRGGRCGVHTLSGAVILAELGTALADQIFQRVGGRLDAERFHLVARRPRQGLVVVLRGRQPKLPRQFRIERGDRRRRAVIGLRRFVKAGCIAFRDILAGPARRGPRAVRGGLAAGAAIPGIVRRRLQAGARAHPGVAAIDRGIEQFRERRPDRLHVGPMCLGIWRLGVRCLGFRGLPAFLGVSGFFAMGPIWDADRQLSSRARGPICCCARRRVRYFK